MGDLRRDSVEIIETDPSDPRAETCLRAYFRELAGRFPIGFDPELALPLPSDDMRPPAGAFFVAIAGTEPIGCAALKCSDGEFEVKRMWVDPSARGLGVGRRLLTTVETAAGDRQARRLRLDTNAHLIEAVALYRGAGYREIDRFNDEQYADHFFEKVLDD